MAKTPEGKVKDAIKARLMAAGAYYTMPVKMGYGSNGELDFNVGFLDRRLDIEAKAKGNTPSELQWHHIERITASGCSSLVIDETNLYLLDAWLVDQARVRPVRKPTNRGVLRHEHY